MSADADKGVIEVNDHTRASEKVVEKVREEVKALRQASNEDEGG